MIDIFITGSNGFVGQNFINKYHNEFLINTYVRETNILINSSVIINFAGKAHDLKNVLNPEESQIRNYGLAHYADPIHVPVTA